MSIKKGPQIKSLESNEAAIPLQLTKVELGDSQHFEVAALSKKANQYLVLNGGFQPIKWLQFLQATILT
jgi:hypothetical protein